MKAMGQVLSKAREQLYDCKLVTTKLRAMLQSADEQVRSLKRQSTFLSQLAAKTIPNGIHCLSMRLTIDYYLLPPEKRKFPRSENLENPDLFHYALFSDNVLAASVVVNSTIVNAKVNSVWYFGDRHPHLPLKILLCLRETLYFLDCYLPLASALSYHSIHDNNHQTLKKHAIVGVLWIYFTALHVSVVHLLYYWL